MSPNEPVLDRLDRLVRLGELLLEALARLEIRLTQVSSAPPLDGELWTASEVAGFLRCSKSKVYQHAAAGRLPCFHVGGQLRFEPVAVKTWAHGEPVQRSIVELRP